MSWNYSGYFGQLKTLKIVMTETLALLSILKNSLTENIIKIDYQNGLIVFYRFNV